MARVMCFGTFDLLHPGHEEYFRQAREFGDELIVVVGRDRTVLEVKGQLPRTNEEDRRSRVEAHPLVTRAVLGSHDDKYQVLEDHRPDVIVLGYDQLAFTEALADELARRGLSARIERAEPFEPERYHSSLLREAALVQNDDEDDTLPL
jgi:FAD synthetase